MVFNLFSASNALKWLTSGLFQYFSWTSVFCDFFASIFVVLRALISLLSAVFSRGKPFKVSLISLSITKEWKFLEMVDSNLYLMPFGCRIFVFFFILTWFVCNIVGAPWISIFFRFKRIKMAYLMFVSIFLMGLWILHVFCLNFCCSAGAHEASKCRVFEGKPFKVSLISRTITKEWKFLEMVDF